MASNEAPTRIDTPATSSGVCDVLPVSGSSPGVAVACTVVLVSLEPPPCVVTVAGTVVVDEPRVVTVGSDVVVVGSGAGGGVVAGELAQRGRRVLLLEAGPHLTAADFVRWEAKATHDLWWPLRLAPLANGEMLAFLAGRCVGGTTTINTKVALRAHERDVAKWHPATGLTNDRGEPFSRAELDPYYDRVEQVLGVRERSDWKKSVRTVESGFDALGAELEPVHSYTDVNCMSCGSCLQGCPTNAGKSTQNTYIHEAWARGLLDLRADAAVERVLV